jgi:hypothetical protein|tara:strand:- start:4876 stop:5220 length:345 start_codon:yes stop_codon:yes gene_type:complete
MRRQLGQLRPANTNAASVFTPTETKEYRIYSIHIANVGTEASNASIYHDANGSTYNQTTAIMYGTAVPVGGTVIIELPLGIGDYQVAGNIGVQSSVASTLNFTIYGEILGEVLG